MSSTDTTESTAHHQRTIPIVIDRRRYEAPHTPMTGTQLRQLAAPHIGADRDLYLDVPGTGGRLIADQQEVPLKADMVFFSVPKTINEG